MVEKTDGTWHPCGDYRFLNIATKPDLYPPPHMEDLSARLSGKKVFSKLDLRKGYYQVPVAPKDIEKTAVITPFGLYEFLWMPFGLRNTRQSFHWFMEEVLLGIPTLSSTWMTSWWPARQQSSTRRISRRFYSACRSLDWSSTTRSVSAMPPRWNSWATWWMPQASVCTRHVCRPSAPSHSPPQRVNCSVSWG